MEMIDVLKKLESIAETRPELVKDAVDNVTRTNPAVQTERVGGMSDVHIGAEEVVGQYSDEDGNLKMPKADVLKAMAAEKAKTSFPKSYEIDVAMDMVNDKFDDSGEAKPDMDMNSEQPAQEQESTRDMTTENKEQVNEAIQISTDSPQEASMMMQILKLAGVQPVDAKMIGADEPQQDMDHGQDDAMGTMQMAKMRDMMTAPEQEKAEETFANSMGTEKEEPKYQDTDTLVNTMSGGLNSQKKTYPRVSPGDNPMAMEDKITEEDLANSLRAQYEGFKKAYQEAAKPDYIDLDKDGNKTEPMKKAAKDKEAKEKK
jgi:hypothetical protein